MKKNIALFQTAMDVGGIQKSLINLLNRIDYEKYNIDLYILGGGSFFKQIPSKVNVIVLDNKKWYKYVPFKAVYHLTKVDKSIKYDVSIDFNGYNNYLSSHALKIDAKRKVLFVHNDFKKKYLNERKFRILYNLSKKKYGMYDDVVSVSLGVKNSFYELTGIKAKYVIPNYIDTKKIIDSSMDNVDFHVDDENINLCFLGRLVYQKGLDLLFPILKKYSKVNPEFHLYVIGDGDKKDELIKQVEDLDLCDNVTFLGSKINPYPYVKMCDYLILNSRYEGQGMVALEAMCLGLKVIMPKNLSEYLDIDYIDIKDIDKISKFRKKINKLDDYNKMIDVKIDELFGGEI